MQLAQACEALKMGLRLEMTYSGAKRVIEIHAAGYTKDEKPILRAWQVRGGSHGGSQTGWKLFHLDEIALASVLKEDSEAPRPGYKRNDPAIFRIQCQI